MILTAREADRIEKLIKFKALKLLPEFPEHR